MENVCVKARHLKNSKIHIVGDFLGNFLFSYSKLLDNHGNVWGYTSIKFHSGRCIKLFSAIGQAGIGITLIISIFSSIILLYAMRLTFLRPFDDLAKAMRDCR